MYPISNKLVLSIPKNWALSWKINSPPLYSSSNKLAWALYSRCRDRGRGGVDEGAWCLSSLGCDLVAPRSPHWLALPQGQAPGPHPSPHPPPVPTGRVTHIILCGRQHSSGNSLYLPLRRLQRLQRHPPPNCSSGGIGK